MRISNIEFFIARRLAAGPSHENRNVMLRIASLTVAVSICVMIISLAVIRGFRGEITDKLVGFGAHLQLVSLENNSSMETTPIHRDPDLEKSLSNVNNFAGLHAYSTKGGIITSDNAMQGILLKGVDSSYDSLFFYNTLVEGRLPRVGADPRTKDILISKKLSDLVGLGVDDSAQMLFIEEGELPRRDRFRVSGIYDSGLEELDKIMILTDMRNVQRLSGWGADQITGYEMTTTDFDHLERFEAGVYDVIVAREGDDNERMMVVSVKQRFMNLFDWLTAHNVNGAVIITIMILVAFFNMVAAMLIILLERTSMIGVLKAMGMTNWTVQKIFIIRSSYMIFKGLVWGNIIGVGLCLIQKYTHLIELDQTGYFLSEVPVSLGWWLVTLNVCCFVVLTLLQTIPTMIVSRFKPEKSIRYQ